MMPRTSIFLAAEDVARLRSQIHNPHMARIWERTRRTADRIAGEQSVSFAEDTMELWYVFRNRCIDLGIALLATGEKRYARAAHAVLQDLAQRSVDFWQGPHYPNRPRTQMVDGVETLVGELETAQLTMGLALLYDLAYEHLAEEDRALALHLLRQRAYPLLRASVRFQSQKWVMNHLCVIASAWLAALLLLPKGEREEADFALAVHSLNLWLGNLESDGSYGEGYHYWAYPVNCLYFALQALRNALGMRLEREGRLARAFEWALYHQAGIIREAGYEKPIAASVNFHDCPRFFQMEAPEALLFANLMGNSVAQWYIQRFLLEDLSRAGGVVARLLAQGGRAFARALSAGSPLAFTATGGMGDCAVLYGHGIPVPPFWLEYGKRSGICHGKRRGNAFSRTRAPRPEQLFAVRQGRIVLGGPGAFLLPRRIAQRL